MSDFDKRWNPQNKEGLGERVRAAVRPEQPLKARIEQAVRLLQAQIAKLDNTGARLKEKDSTYFQKVVHYLQKHDNDRANIYATELAEIRKMYRMLMQAKLALEEIVTRLTTATDIGDVVATLAPAMAVISSVRKGINGVMPAAEGEMSEISSLLNNILVDAGTIYGSSINFEAASEDAEKILSEAAAVAEAKMNQTLPDVSGLGLGSEESKQ